MLWAWYLSAVVTQGDGSCVERCLMHDSDLGPKGCCVELVITCSTSLSVTQTT